MHPLPILLGIAAVCYVVVRRMAGEPLQGRRLVLMPLGLVLFGGVNLLTSAVHPGLLDVVVLSFEAIAMIGVGTLRGWTVEVFVRDGQPWQRYRPMTFVVWLASAAVRLGALWLGYRFGVDHKILSTSPLFMIGLTLLAEGVVIGRRALARQAGVPLGWPVSRPAGQGWRD